MVSDGGVDGAPRSVEASDHGDVGMDLGQAESVEASLLQCRSVPGSGTDLEEAVCGRIRGMHVESVGTSGGEGRCAEGDQAGWHQTVDIDSPEGQSVQRREGNSRAEFVSGGCSIVFVQKRSQTIEG